MHGGMKASSVRSGLNGVEVSVTANLESALRHMRLQNQTRMLWADAICINQSDIAEKNIQVRLMGEIYTSCSKCLVWLGEEDEEDGQTAFDFIEELSRQDHIITNQCNRNPDSQEPCRGNFPALGRPMHRPWWSRAWVVQEALLPEDVEYWCENRSINISTLIKASFSLEGYLNSDTAGCKEGESSLRDVFTFQNFIQSTRKGTMQTCEPLEEWSASTYGIL
jgi:hypothetical protein